MLKKVLETVISFIKYPFLGLFFIVNSVVNFIFYFIKYILKGITFILYLIAKPFIIIYRKLNKKSSKRNINKNTTKLEKIENNENKKIIVEEKNRIKQEKIDKRNELKEQKRLQIEEARKLKNEQILLKKQEKEEKKRLALEEKNRIKQEKIDKRNELKEQKRLKIEEARKLKNEQILLKKQEQEEKKRLALEEKNRIKQERLAKKEELREQRKLLKEERKLKKKEQQQERLNNNERYQKKLQRQEQKRLEKERQEQLKKEKLEKQATLELEKEQEKEAKLVKKLQEREERKLEKEKVKQAKAELKKQRKQLPLNRRILIILKTIFISPIILAKKILVWFNNLSFIKNARNKRDINRQALMLEFEGKDAEKNPTKIVYVYEAKNPEGKIVKERFAAYSKVEVHSFLLSEGYEVYSIKTNPFIQFLYKENGSVKFKTKDLVFFLTQLSTYLKAGITLVDSLKILSRQYKKRTYKDIFRTMIYDLSTGESFSSAMTKQGNTFPRLLINMVKAAELTGELTEALDDMAEYYSETEKTKKQMINALMYPTIVFFVAICVVVFILIFVIPKFVQMYESMDASKIPAFTKAVIAASEFIKNYILFIIIGIVVFIILFVVLYKKVTTFRTIVQWILMHLPVIGNVIIYNEVTMFTKTFSSLLSHNVYITDSMEILNKVTNNEIYKMLILDTVTNLAKGEKISLAFKDHWAFPIPAYEMLVTGESTGQLAEMMNKVSVYYQELHEDVVTKIKTLLEPIIIIFLTVVVGIIVLAIVIPMFNLYQTIQQI